MNAKEALEAINNALFPMPRKEQGGVMVSSDAYANLQGVRIDLKRMDADVVCIRTIERVQKQLLEVSKILHLMGFPNRESQHRQIQAPPGNEDER
jgi:hypothetical protein